MMKMLSIGGFDPSCASGVQRDMRVASSLGLYPLSVTTAITTQNTSEFGSVHPLSVDVISSQLDAVLSDFEVDAIKVGMLYSANIMHAIQGTLKNASVPIILDPVVQSTTGGSLIQNSAKETLLDAVLPHSFVVTPNLAEARYLTGIKDDGLVGARKAAILLYRRGADNVIITGIKDDNNQIVDVLYDGSFHYVRGERLAGENRGGGCTYSAILACLVTSNSVAAAAEQAHRMTHDALHTTIKIGKTTPISSELPSSKLASAIGSVVSLPHMYRLIPQCQTNFVHAPEGATRPDEVLGVRGRLVRVGRQVILTGVISLGGSKHVASAVCAMRGRFPDMRSAINIRYSQEMLSRLVRAGFTIVYYDRESEPQYIKESGSSILWGISRAVEQCEEPPDAICHRGDFGKEPMIILFGVTPSDVASKIRKLIPPTKLGDDPNSH
ncbi:MAG: bifunctional hydroxymethylpyrimidine kinase/phosphomethylpyrimidine kinase [Cenarchaeum sp. SB0661_bin_35]|nr:bifunctional hydroxymethylpyrimidine kinase/phosphomethylpyrimidine kinase [Cenarchaeum sp. SB0666_bin_15]MYB47317.1 bifunctional hydroxymethylpyrimidine kinase/phosphomethylpyrimidine kinase [Cenarchaeum sp. SB0662_bin_33]MYC79796.1 bifunctional hydroxymethylpyrimidine kinase/phosphomethylpyrimidine kinase [Cenarchaeum sp. SB0661_bin_35]MYD58119.1 bifunctional hydroxymethylpyrimidine kinase/phosphomethylpyrimidine kinase [Cenarchaeum sp. SB0678_bin_8]MYJ27752.1 bifunctional hydroxymethylpyr